MKAWLLLVFFLIAVVGVGSFHFKCVPWRQLRQYSNPYPSVEGPGSNQFDVMSRLLKERIVFVGNDINDELSNNVVSQLLYLSSMDSNLDITMYINSNGGSVQAGLAIFDVMQYIPCDINTVCFGMAASMGAFLLSAGTKGKRRSLPNSRIMIHQPLGGGQGEASDLEVVARNILRTRSLLNGYLAVFSDQPIEKIENDTERDFFLTPSEALDYGLIDEVITHRRMIPRPIMPSLELENKIIPSSTRFVEKNDDCATMLSSDFD